MPKKVDKEKRKDAILNTALKVFSKDGYKETNLSLIAEQSGVSRPTIYQYFQDKNDIFYYAVKRVTDKMFLSYSKIAWDKESGEDDIERILHICREVLDYASSNEDSLANLFEFMISEKKRGSDFSQMIDKRTIRLQILIKRLVREGIDKGTIKKSVNIEELSSNLFNLVEACCIQLAFFKTFNKENAYKIVESYLNYNRA